MPKTPAERKRDQRARDRLPGGRYEKTYRATKEEHEQILYKLDILYADNAPYVNTFKGYTSRTIARIKDKCKKKDLPFDLDIKWFRDQLSNGKCQASGIPFDRNWFNRTTELRVNPFQPVIDRITPSLGYTKTNCRVVCYIYNTCKFDFTDEDVEQLCLAVLREKGYTVTPPLEIYNYIQEIYHLPKRGI